MANLTLDARNSLKDIGNKILNGAADLLSSSDFISRTIGMNNSYEDIMYIVQSLGRKPISLLGKDYLFIYDHVRRNYQQGTTVASMMYGGGNYWCPKFTFYKERPTIKFADVYNDPLNLLARWMPDVKFNTTMFSTTERFYAESNDGEKNNKVINGVEGNPGTASAQIVESFQNLEGCDLLRKTNENFINGKFNTLVARFHTNTDESRRLDDPTQTAVTDRYGMSHGRNLLKVTPDSPNGYNNPYCRVWTYHHQYHTINDMIRPFGDGLKISTAQQLENAEIMGSGDTVGFRTVSSDKYDVEGGSSRLDTHGVLNYNNGFVNIAPTAKLTDYFDRNIDDKNDKAVSIKKCMFSLENLAWRDDRARNDEYQPTGTSPEQRGPLGGRIMWFPPYDISFSETVAVKWNSNEFIGRGENIYTYTNTERRGNLSFTLLIDHPSILDYWTGHDAPRGSLKNGIEDLLPGNTDGVDEVRNQEQTLLRFFAGCDVLTAQPQKYKKHNDSPKEEVEKEKPNPMNNTGKPEKKAGKVLCCAVYFPNNYSGIDDLNVKEIKPIHYLMNGVGCQEYIKEQEGTGFLESTVIPTTLSPITVCEGTVTPNAPCGDENNCSKACDENGKVTNWTNSDMSFGGYEVHDTSISIVSDILDNSTDIRKKTFACLGEGKDKKGQFLTNNDGTKRYAIQSGDTYLTLSKLIGDAAKPYSKNNMTGNEWLYRRWYYRVDKFATYGKNEKFINDKLTHPLSYIDLNQMRLNANGFDFRGKLSKENWISYIEEDADDYKLVSFSDLFAAIETDNNVIAGVPENLDIISKIIDGNSGFKIKKVTVCGNASNAGHIEENEVLAKNRAEVVSRWLKNCKKFPEPEKGYEVTSVTQDKEKKSHVNNGNESKVDAKVWRSAVIKIEYEQAETEQATNQEASYVEHDSYDIPVDKDGNHVEQGVTKTSKEYNEFKNFIKTSEGEKWVRSNRSDSNNPILKLFNFEPENDETALFRKYQEYKKSLSQDEEKQDEDPQVEETGTVERYDNEGEFFKLLEKKDAFLHHLVTDKIKYFDPAYHAISPEGFNARLTFLHQCTRQGATIGVSDDTTLTAHNLAFGRPPICVLRLGDFYYTKIVINSLTINYEDVQWDLNPEGIGVMPMFAKVNIDFTFLGGSDLAGPIARLQNAVSFNYYANTSVYDDRAEVVEYDPKGSGKEIKYKPFTYMDGTKTIDNSGIVNDTNTNKDKKGKS